MGLFDFFKPKAKPFVSPSAYAANKTNQAQMATQTLGQLRKLNVTETCELKLEFFFYTNIHEKAQALTADLVNLGYEANNSVSAGNSKEYVITGWTTKMPMTNQAVAEWANQMTELGYKHDCEFDGWGTTPDQE